MDNWENNNMSGSGEERSELGVRTSEIEKTQASHEQILRGLVDRIEDVAVKMGQLDNRLAAIETIKPPYANMIAFAAVCITLVTVLGYLGSEPTRISVSNIREDIHRIVNKMDLDDIRERNDAAAFAALSGKVSQQESLNNHLHVTKKQQIEKLLNTVYKKDWGE